MFHALYRMAVAGRHLAAAISALVEKTASTLVTDSLDHRAPHLPFSVRFYPVHHRQIEQLTERYRASGTADDALGASLIRRARVVGEPIARAGLDTALNELCPPPAPTLSGKQSKILQRIVADSERRTARFFSAVQRVQQPAVPLQEQGHDATRAPHGPRQ